MEIWDKVKKSKFFQDLEAQEQKELLQERTEAAAIFRKAEQEENEAMPGLIKKVTEKHNAVLKIQKELDKALQVLQVAELEKMNTAAHYTRLKDKQWSFLNMTASQEIDAGIEFFNDEIARLRRPGLITTVKAGERTNLIDLSKDATFETNKHWILSRIQYCKAAISALEKLKLEPELDPEAIQRLKDGLPEEAWTPISGKRNLNKPAPTAAELLPGLAAIADQKIEQLLHPERFKKYKPTTAELLNS